MTGSLSATVDRSKEAPASDGQITKKSDIVVRWSMVPSSNG